MHHLGQPQIFFFRMFKKNPNKVHFIIDVFSDTHSPYALNSFQCTVLMKFKPSEKPILRFIYLRTEG